MVRRRKSNGKAKSCGIHDLLRDLSVSEAQKDKFLDVIRINQGHNFSATNHHSSRFSSHTKIFLSKFSESAEVMRSLYLFHEPHRGAKETLQLKALRVLSVFPYNSFGFQPHITLHSAILRYLEITTDNHFNESLACMHNLQTLIFACRNISFDENLTLPGQIWNMKQLKHFRISDSIYLPNPPATMSRTNGKDGNCALGLQNLEELSSLCLASCTKEVFDGLPHLRKLLIYDNGEKVKGFEDTSRNLLNLVHLNKLEKLSCFLAKPFRCSLKDRFSFPVSLKKLKLWSGGFPWEDMAILAKLPNLEVLKLRNSAFKGGVWRMNDEDQFNELKFLMIACVDLDHWEVSSVNFPNLQCLVLQKMYCLQIPPDILDICTLESIEFYKCNTKEDLAKELQEEAAAVAGNDCLRVHIYEESYDDVKKRF